MAQRTTAPPGNRDDWTDLTAGTAIPRLVEEHGDRIYGLALRTCGNPDDAEELVQETFLNAFKRWDGFEGRSDPSTWLYTIAIRACRRMHRLKSGEPRTKLSLDDLLPSHEDGVPDLEPFDDGQLGEQVRDEARRAVEAAISSLPINFRLPLILKELADFSIGEISEILGIKEGTVKTRVHRGRLLLRKALAGVLPTAGAPAPDHPKQVCLDLLRAKQEAMDKGVPFPYPASELCVRCQSLFATMDLAKNVCVDLRGGELPAELRRAIAAQPLGA